MYTNIEMPIDGKWAEHLEDSSLPGGLLRCIKSLSELWGTDEVCLFIRNPSGNNLNSFSLDSNGGLRRKGGVSPDGVTLQLLFGASDSDMHLDQNQSHFYLRQRRAGRPHSVLRVQNSPIMGYGKEEILDSTRALLMAAASYAESYSHIEGATEPVIEQRLKSEFRDYLQPICRKIAKRSFLISSAFFSAGSGGSPELLHNSHYDFPDQKILLGPKTLKLIRKYLTRNGFPNEEPVMMSMPEFGRFKDTNDMLFSNTSSICSVRIERPYFDGLIIFGVPINYELTSSDQAMMRLIRDQLKNYVYVYHSFNSERYDLLKQQQEFGLEYAREFTQVARHAARQNIGDIAVYSQTLSLIAEQGGVDEEGRLEAYKGLEDALEQIEMVYTEVQSLSDSDVEPVRFNLRALFEDMSAVFHATFEDLGVSYRNELSDDWIIAFEQQVKVAVFNLIQNSCEAFVHNEIPQTSRRITISHSGRKSRPIAYDDSAGGIAKLFNSRGEQVKDAQLAWQRGVSGRGGSGFGMTIIKRYFEANDCTISFANYRTGTRFLIDVGSARSRAN